MQKSLAVAAGKHLKRTQNASQTVIFARAMVEALGNGPLCEREALGIAGNPRFTLCLEGIREGHQGASGGIR